MIIEHFQGLTDPRIERCQRRYLLDILALVLGVVVWRWRTIGWRLPSLDQPRGTGCGGFCPGPTGYLLTILWGGFSAGWIRSSFKPASWIGRGRCAS